MVFHYSFAIQSYYVIQDHSTSIQDSQFHYYFSFYSCKRTKRTTKSFLTNLKTEITTLIVVRNDKKTFKFSMDDRMFFGISAMLQLCYISLSWFIYIRSSYFVFSYFALSRESNSIQPSFGLLKKRSLKYTNFKVYFYVEKEWTASVLKVIFQNNSWKNGFGYVDLIYFLELQKGSYENND